jgi:hypothetical protein
MQHQGLSLCVIVAQPFLPPNSRSLLTAHCTQPIAHCSLLIAQSRNKKIAVVHPQKPQQIHMSSPSTPKNPHNSHPTNHFHQKNSWHSSYAPLATINIWIESIEGQL